MNDETNGFSTRTQRLLVQVLLALRGEARRSPDPSHDRARAEALADQILLQFPRRVVPIGATVLVALVVYSGMPLVRDALPGAGIVEREQPVAEVIETGLRERGSAIGDGLGAIGALVAPLAIEEIPAEETGTGAPAEASAEAPFSKS